MVKNENRNNFLFKLLLITIFFNIWFPKAGIKIFTNVPLTIGNVFFAILFLCWGFNKIKKSFMKSSPIDFVLILSIFFYILRYIIVLSSGESIVKYVTYIIPLIIYPLMFFVAYDLIDTTEKWNKVFKIIYYGFFFLCFYALLQSIVGIGNCTIPGLTVNYSDYKKYGYYWFLQKANGTDINNAKIVSTYQNGNLFGVNMLLFYPLIYNYLKNKNTIKLYFSLILFIVSVFLSLSRTCWLGIVLFIILGIFFENEKTKFSLLRKILIIMMIPVALLLIFKYMPTVVNRFTNTSSSDLVSMSGRTDGLLTVFRTVLESKSLLAWVIGPNAIINYSGWAYEMLPLSLFVQTGLLGLFLFYSIFFIILKKLKNITKGKSIKLSFIIWLIIGCIECGYWLPPTSLNIFIIIALGLSLNNMEEEEIN